MKKSYLVLPLLALFFLSVGTGVAGAETDSSYRLLFVDETRSLEISMRVQGLVNGLQGREGLVVDTRSFQVDDPTVNPLTETPEEPYDLVVVVPPTIETGRIKQVWLVTRPLSHFPPERKKQAAAQLGQLKEAVSRAFKGEVTPVGVNDDVIPAYLSGLFLREGVLR